MILSTTIAGVPVRVLNGEFAVKSGKRRAPRCCGLLRAIEILTPNRLSAEVDATFPFAVMGTKAHTDKSAGIVGLFFAIERIFSMSRFAKIFHAIVGRIAVNVVQFFNWPETSDNQPNYAMRQVEPVIYSHGYATTNLATSRLASAARIPLFWALRIVLPKQQSKRGVVFQNLPSRFGGQVVANLDRHFLSYESGQQELAVAREHQQINYRSA